MNKDNRVLKPLKIGELVAEKPIIQGGMGVGVSRSSLAGAVAAEGGIGIISTAQIGYDEEGFEKDQAGCNRIAIKKHIKRAKEIAGGKGLVGVNIMVALKHYKEHVQEAVKAGADVIISGAGLPMDLPKLVGENVTKIAPIVSSKRAAQLILKMWAHRYVPCGARRVGADRPAGQQRRSGRRIRAPRPRVDGRLERHDRHQRQGAALRLADRRAQDDRRGRRAHRQHRLDRRHRTLRERRRLLRHQARRARHFAVDARRPALARHQGERSASRHGRDRILGGALPRRPHGCRQRLSGRRAPHGRRHSRSDRMDRTITGAYER